MRLTKDVFEELDEHVDAIARETRDHRPGHRCAAPAAIFRRATT